MAGTSQKKLGDLIIAGISPGGNIAQVNAFADGIVEFVSGDTTALNGAIDAPPATQVGGGILPFFTHLTGSPNPWKEYLVLPSTIQAGDVVSITIDGATHAITLPGTFVATGTPIKYDGDRINGNIPNAELVSGAGDDLGGPIVAVNTTRLAPGQRGLVVYEHQPATAGGGKMFVLKPNQVSGIALPAFRTVATRPATGTVPGEAVLVTTSGLSFIWDGLQWNSIVPPSVVAYPTDAAVLLDTPAAGTYAFSRATGNLFVRFNDGTTGAVDQWREIGVMKYPLEAGLLADTTADGSIAYAMDTGNYYQRNGVNWQPFGVMREVEATILASTYADAAIAYATDTDRFWIHVDGAWQPFGLYQDTEPNILATTPRDGTRAYAIDTNNGWDRVDGAWVPAGVLHDTEANILAATYPNGTRAYSTDTNLLWERTNGAWFPASYLRDTDANIQAATPTAGLIGVATDTGKLYYADGAAWIGQPFRDYPTEAGLLAATPADGVMAVAVDTGMVFYRTGGAWVSINRYATPIGTTDPAVATSAQGDLFYNRTDQVAKLFDGAAWQAIGNPSQWAIGSIQQSILTHAQFNASLPVTERGKWKIATGQDITGTALATLTGQNTLPDLRGAYFRMAGQNASNSAWDGGALGGWQEDNTARPKQQFTTNTTGDHYHSKGTYEQERQDMMQQYHNNTAANPSALMAGKRKGEDANLAGSAEGAANELEEATSTDGQHMHAINGGGDTETRPKTYSVNYFIKVD